MKEMRVGNSAPAKSFIAGTAGHIDHGKTSLIRALTGTDTDRLKEEKQRGISIDIGFAHFELPDGATISFIDAPGHERFVKNMLAGASGFRAVLLVVAADESVMPQTREHFQICRLLGIETGFVVLTKCDLATPEQIEQTRADLADLCKGSFLEGAPVIEVSTKTGAGLERVREQLQRLASSITTQSGSGIARLAIDRSFTMKGHGTVVTGSLSGGTLASGSTVMLHPGRRQLRVRGLQVHGRPVQQANPGERVAVNLAGIEHSHMVRGNVLTDNSLVETSSLLAVRLEWLGEQPAITSARTELHVHIGAAEIAGRVRPLNESFAYLWLAEPVLAIPGDRFILRQPSPPDTIAGGVVIDAFPRKRLNRTRALQRLTDLANATADHRIFTLVAETPAGKPVSGLVRLTGLPLADIKRLIATNPDLIMNAGETLVVTKAWVDRQRAAVARWLVSFHQQNPHRNGAPVSSARLFLTPAQAGIVFAGWSAVRIEGDSIALANHRASYSDGDSKALLAIEAAFRSGGYAPPLAADVLKTVAADPAKARGLLETLVKSNRLVRVSGDLIFHVDVLAHIRASLAKHKGRRFSVPEFKEWTQISRKYAIPLLEYLDHQRVTRRDGDIRIVL